MGYSVLVESQGKAIVVGPNWQHAGALPSFSVQQTWPAVLDWQTNTGCDGTGTEPANNDQLSGWRFRKQVTLIVQDETARVLDTRLGNFYALDSVGTRMLFATLESGSESMIRTIAHDFGVHEEQVRQDWAALVDGFQTAGLTETVSHRPKTVRMPGTLAIWLRLTLACVSFRLLGWDRTVRAWRGRSSPAARTTTDDPGSTIAATDRLIRRIASRHPLNPQCKERSLVSWYVLRKLGLPARLVMGVMVYPFTAHAWTECLGHIVGDDRARCEQFAPVAVHE
jgi:Transglutaminase-like superfamily